MFLRNLRRLLNVLEDFCVPTLSAVSGFALGGGLELALSTDLRVFDSSAVVGLPETKLGIIPGAGGIYRLRDVIGRPHALDLILTGRRVDASEAFRLGLCSRLVDEKAQSVGTEGVLHGQTSSAVIQKAIEVAEQISEGAPQSLSSVKEVLAFGPQRGRDKLAEYKEYTDLLLVSTDRDEALKAFQEKRKPVFTGGYKNLDVSVARNREAKKMLKSDPRTSVHAELAAINYKLNKVVSRHGV